MTRQHYATRLATTLTCTALAFSGANTFAQDASARIIALEQKVEALTQEMKHTQLGDVFIKPTESIHGMGASASKIYQTTEGVSIGGYGEALYQNFDGDKSSQADFLRAVLYFGHKFNDQWLLNTEIEFEHASTGEDGSVSVEFAYLDYLMKDALNLRVGLVLIPMGFVNELHEPNAFLSARRTDIESTIIPSTWRENGVGLFGNAGNVSYKAYIVNGLDAKDFSASGLRGGRQKGSKALAEDLAVVGRVDWRPTPALILGGSLYHGDSGQDLDLDVTTDIAEGHIELRRGPLQLRGLITQAELDDVAALNRVTATPADDGTLPADSGIDSIGSRLAGWYVEAGLDITDWLMSDTEATITPFVRYSQYNTQDDTPAGFKTSSQNDIDVVTVGVNLKPIDQIVFKIDYQFYDDSADTGNDQFNLSAGYVF
jgi:hypothetical protein